MVQDTLGEGGEIECVFADLVPGADPMVSPTAIARTSVAASETDLAISLATATISYDGVPVVSASYSAPRGMTFYWLADGTVSAGDSADPDGIEQPYPYARSFGTAPGSFAELRAVAFGPHPDDPGDASRDATYSWWWDSATGQSLLSTGEPWDLVLYQRPFVIDSVAAVTGTFVPADGAGAVSVAFEALTTANLIDATFDDAGKVVAWFVDPESSVAWPTYVPTSMPANWVFVRGTPTDLDADSGISRFGFRLVDPSSSPSIWGLSADTLRSVYLRDGALRSVWQP